jgi:glycine/D-amino acid oxidase-like deaminating enzyme
MRIAIIGTGISGMTAAYLLSEDHEVVVFLLSSKPTTMWAVTPTPQTYLSTESNTQ